MVMTQEDPPPVAASPTSRATGAQATPPTSTSRMGIAHHPATAPLLVGLLTTVLLSIGITTPSIWYDEAATVASAQRSWSGLIGEIGTVDLVHALYYAFMHVLFDVVGYSPLTLRLPSAIAIGSTAGLLVVLGRMLGSARLGLIAGVVLATLPRATWAATEGRSYALTALAATVLTLVLIRALRSDRRRPWVLYGVLAAASVLLFIYLALIVIAHGVAVALMRERRHGARRRWLVAAAAPGVALVPFALAAAAQSDQIGWLTPLGTDTIRQVFRTQWFYTSTTYAVVAWLLLLAGIAVLIRTRRAVPARAALLVSGLVVPTTIVLAVTAAGHPVYTPRYLTLCLPFVALVMAAAIDAMLLKPARWLAVALLVVIALPQVAHQREPETKQESAWNTVADFMAHELPVDRDRVGIVWGTIQFHPRATARVIEHAYPEPFAGTTDVTLDRSTDDSGRLWETTRPLADSLGRLDQIDAVYLVTSTARDQRPEVTQTLADAGWAPSAEWEFTNVHVVEYERVP